MLGILTVGVPPLAFQDLRHRRQALLEARGDALEQLGRFAESSLRAEEARRSAALRQLRAALRRQGLWQQALGPAPEEEADLEADLEAEGQADREKQDPQDAASRQLVSLLRRALQASDDLRAFLILMADERGISLHRFDGQAATAIAERPQAQSAPDRAEDLWYAEDIRRAVAAAGRQVESSPWTWEAGGEGGGSRVGSRRTIALHDSGELVQGVLVAELDPSAWVVELAALPGSTGTLELRSVQGRSLVDAADPVDEADRRAFEWAARVRPEAGPAARFESDGRLIAGGRLEAGEAGARDLIWLARAPAPASVWASAWRSPWSLGVLALGLATGLTGWSLGMRPEPAVLAAESDSVAPGSSDAQSGAREAPEASPPDPSPPGAEAIESVDVIDEVEAPEAAMPPVAGPEPFVLRDWLSDVRSCLEREAARRGLALEMRCARALPPEIESDPVGLGALLLALGRDALDGTAGDRISIDVVGGPDANLRFELDAGDGSLVPPTGLGVFARTLGAEIESRSDHRVALVLARTLH